MEQQEYLQARKAQMKEEQVQNPGLDRAISLHAVQGQCNNWHLCKNGAITAIRRASQESESTKKTHRYFFSSRRTTPKRLMHPDLLASPRIAVVGNVSLWSSLRSLRIPKKRMSMQSKN